MSGHRWPKPPMAPRKMDPDKNPEDIDNIVARQRELEKDSYTVRINKSTVIIKTKNK